MKQTAVEWIIDQLRQLSHSLEAHLGMGDIRVTQGMIDDFEEQAKQMEKEQRRDAYDQGKADVIRVAIESMDAKLSNSNE